MENQFPPVLAFGKLDKTSIYEEDGFQFAHYLQDGELVHEFGFNHSLVQITDIIKGRRARWSFAPDIKKLFHLHFCIDYDFSENNPIIERLSRIVRCSGNYYVSLKNPNYCFFNKEITPHFRRILIRVPLASYDFGVMIRALEVEPIAAALIALYPVFIQATQEKAGIVANHRYLVANMDFITTVGELIDFCRLLVTFNLISAGKMNQAIVMELEDGNSRSGFSIPGKISDPFFEYDYPFQEPFLHKALYWGYSSINRVTNWINQYNNWQDTLYKQSSSFQYCILPFILKNILAEGFIFQNQYSAEEILTAKIYLKNESLWLQKTSETRVNFQEEIIFLPMLELSQASPKLHK